MTRNSRGPRFLPGIDPCLLGLCLLGLAAPLCGAEQGPADSPHRIEVCQPVLSAEDGLLLGNGDLSVSVYQAADRIVWRFGKGDVWDRRLDLSDDPKPAHISEIAHGIKVEGWKCPPYGGGTVEATRGTSNPQRMKELCQGRRPATRSAPTPAPSRSANWPFTCRPTSGACKSRSG